MGLIDQIQQLLGLNARQEFGGDQPAVSWSPEVASPGDAVRISYNGPLRDSGAGEVYLHYGFDGWRPPVRTVRMERSETGILKAEFNADGVNEVNFCFKDAEGNWDNNGGRDWRLPLNGYGEK